MKLYQLLIDVDYLLFILQIYDIFINLITFLYNIIKLITYIIYNNFCSSPVAIIPTVLSQPPICLPDMKIFGTVF